MGNSLVELCSHIGNGGIGRTGAIRKGWSVPSGTLRRAAGSDPYGSRSNENEKLARNGRCRDHLDYGFTLSLLEALELDNLQPVRWLW